MYLITDCIPDGDDSLLVLYDRSVLARAEVLYDPENDAVACLTCADPHCVHAEAVRALLDLPGQDPTAPAARIGTRPPHCASFDLTASVDMGLDPTLSA